MSPGIFLSRPTSGIVVLKKENQSSKGDQKVSERFFNHQRGHFRKIPCDSFQSVNIKFPQHFHKRNGHSSVYKTQKCKDLYVLSFCRFYTELT